MPRKVSTYKQPSYVSGLTVDQILNMDEKAFESLLKDNASDARKLTGRLVSAANKRIRRFEAKNISSPAYRAVMESGGQFTISGKTSAGVALEFQRARNFLMMKTSSLTGYAKQKEETRAKLELMGIKISKDDYDEIFDVYNRLKKANPNVRQIDSDKILKKIRNMVVHQKNKMTAADIATKLYNQVNKIYEKNKKTEDAAGVSDFFQI